MTDALILITDHCLIRFLERAKGIDLTPIRREIERAVHVARGGKGKRQVSSGGLTFVLEGPRVVTVKNGSSPVGSRVKHSIANGRRVAMQKEDR